MIWVLLQHYQTVILMSPALSLVRLNFAIGLLSGKVSKELFLFHDDILLLPPRVNDFGPLLPGCCAKIDLLMDFRCNLL